MTFFPLWFICTSTRDTFTFIGRNFSSGESDEFFVWWRKFRLTNSFARQKFCPTKFHLIRYLHKWIKFSSIVLIKHLWHHRNTAFGQILGSSGCYQNLMSLKLKLCLNPIHGVQFMKGYLPNPVNCWDTDNSDYVYFYGDNLEIKNNTFLYFLLYQIIHFYVWSQPCDKSLEQNFVESCV